MRENYLLHKLHSLTGIVPVGFYLVQHLALNSFALAGPEKYNAVIKFFESMPTHILLVLKYVVVWLPLIFHAVYGLFIVSRSDMPSVGGAYGQFREAKYFRLQRLTGIVAFLFLCYHMYSNSVLGTIEGQEAVNYYHNWAGRLSAPVLGVPFFLMMVYIVGIVASAYHLCYGIWNFCIRWGVTVSERSQQATAKFSAVAFVVVTFLGVMALVGFFNPVFQHAGEPVEVGVPNQVRPVSQT